MFRDFEVWERAPDAPAATSALAGRDAGPGVAARSSPASAGTAGRIPTPLPVIFVNWEFPADGEAAVDATRQLGGGPPK